MNKQNFLRSEFWILSWNASVQRALKYRKKNEVERAAFREYIISYCNNRILPKYEKDQSESDHINNIVELYEHASSYPDQELLLKPYNLGVSQKLLNLQLKYLWCVGAVETPPHCPVDRIILNHTKLKNKMNWTQITTIADYMKAIDAIKEVAGDKEIALWELESYDRTKG